MNNKAIRSVILVFVVIFLPIVSQAQATQDDTLPLTPVIEDGVATISTSQLTISWQSDDPESGIHHYRIAIGNEPGGSDVLDWTETDKDVVEVINLQLEPGVMYYTSVQAINNVGLASDVGISDGVRCVEVLVFEDTKRTNHYAIGGYQYWFGEECWDSSAGVLTAKYKDLLTKWNFGSVRCYQGKWGNDSTKAPLALALHDWIESDPTSANVLDAWPGPNGEHLGVDGYCAVADVSDAALIWKVNMIGRHDSYGRADTNGDQGVWRGTTLKVPTADEKEKWCDVSTSETNSIFSQTKDMVDDIESQVSKRVYELGNEIYWANYATDIYRKAAGTSTVERIAWGEKFHEQSQRDTDWTTGNTGTNGTVIYVGYPYKPWTIRYQATSYGNGELVWQHHKSDGTWDTITPSAAIIATSSPETCCAEYLNGSDYEDAIHMTTSNECHLFLMPPCEMGDDDNGDPVGYSPSDWESNYDSDPATGPFHKDWVRTQPSELGGSSVRKLYWLRVYASSPYSAVTDITRIDRYYADPIDWLDACSVMYDAIKSADSNAEVYNVGLNFYSSGYEYIPTGLPGLKYRNLFHWYFLKHNDYKNKWDGLVIHPYNGWKNSSQILPMVEDSNEGLLTQINEFRDLMDDENFDTRKIACTEWGGFNYDEKGGTSSLGFALYTLEGNLEIASKRSDGRNVVDLASDFILAPGKDKCSIYYTYPGKKDAFEDQIEDPNYQPGDPLNYPVANTQYIQRPEGLSYELIADQSRANQNGLESASGTQYVKAYAYSEPGKTNSMVLINKDSSSRTVKLCWSQVAGKDVYAKYLDSTTSSPDADNEDPSALEVTLDSSYAYESAVASDGYFTLTLPAYSAVGVEFRD